MPVWSYTLDDTVSDGTCTTITNWHGALSKSKSIREIVLDFLVYQNVFVRNLVHCGVLFVHFSYFLGGNALGNLANIS